MKKCPYCGSENRDEYPVCNKCKAAIPHEKKTNEIEEPEERVFKRKKQGVNEYGT